MVSETDAEVMMAEVTPRDGLLISCLLAQSVILVVQNVIGLQHEAYFVLQDYPTNRAVPNEDVAVHAADCIASAGALSESCIKEEFALCSLDTQAVIIVPKGGVLSGRGGVAEAVGVDFSESGGFEPVVVEREDEPFTKAQTILTVSDVLGLRGKKGEEAMALIGIHAEVTLQTEFVTEALVEIQAEVPRLATPDVFRAAYIDGGRGVIT